MPHHKIGVKYPFQIHWKIDEKDLKNIGQKVGDSVKSKSFSTTFGAKYHLKIYPYGNRSENPGQTWISLRLNFNKPLEFIKVALDISIKYASWSKDFVWEYPKSNEHGCCCCPFIELFDLSKKFIIDGFLNLTIKGTFEINECDKLEEGISSKKRKLSNMFWKDEINKDFTISVENQSLKVHKHILAVYSPVFDRIFKSKMREAIENSVEIPNYPFEVVEIIVKLCYELDISGDDIFYNKTNLFSFADQYMMNQIKEILETFLIKRLSVMNVCALANWSISCKVPKLEACCYDLLMKCLKDGTAVNDLNYLDKDFKLKIFDNAFISIA